MEALGRIKPLTGYSNEHAFVNVWNHSVKNGIATSRDQMHSEIEEAKQNPKHPLHYRKVKPDGFRGKTRRGSSPDLYYDELHHAADTIHDVANHPDFHQEATSGQSASVVGHVRYPLSDNWQNHGARNGTSKADIRIGDKTISYKKSGNSLLMSPQPPEMIAIYDHAASNMVKHGKITKLDHSHIVDHINRVAVPIANMKYSTSAEQTEKFRHEAQFHINHLHNTYPDLIKHVYHEAVSGHGKFNEQEGTASHIITSFDAKKGSATIDNVNDYISGHDKFQIPRVSAPKSKLGGTRPPCAGNLKIDVRGNRRRSYDLTEKLSANVVDFSHIDGGEMGSSIRQDSHSLIKTKQLSMNDVVPFEPSSEKVKAPHSAQTFNSLVGAIKSGNRHTIPPIIVAEHPKLPSKFIVLDGHHRFEAHKKAGSKLIKAQIVSNKNLSFDGKNSMFEQVKTEIK